jgi:hypothetical protein
LLGFDNVIFTKDRTLAESSRKPNRVYRLLKNRILDHDCQIFIGPKVEFVSQWRQSLTARRTAAVFVDDNLDILGEFAERPELEVMLILFVRRNNKYHEQYKHLWDEAVQGYKFRSRDGTCFTHVCLAKSAADVLDIINEMKNSVRLSRSAVSNLSDLASPAEAPGSASAAAAALPNAAFAAPSSLASDAPQPGSASTATSHVSDLRKLLTEEELAAMPLQQLKELVGQMTADDFQACDVELITRIEDEMRHRMKKDAAEEGEPPLKKKKKEKEKEKDMASSEAYPERQAPEDAMEIQGERAAAASAETGVGDLSSAAASANRVDN